jgi:hypothetical protein
MFKLTTAARKKFRAQHKISEDTFLIVIAPGNSNQAQFVLKQITPALEKFRADPEIKSFGLDNFKILVLNHPEHVHIPQNSGQFQGYSAKIRDCRKRRGQIRSYVRRRLRPNPRRLTSRLSRRVPAASHNPKQRIIHVGIPVKHAKPVLITSERGHRQPGLHRTEEHLGSHPGKDLHFIGGALPTTQAQVLLHRTLRGNAG